MKKYILVIIIINAVSSACNNEQSHTSSKAKLPPRDTSVNSSNAYNDLFLDSATLESFITKRDSLNDIGTLLREFYYDRNFEFAWFASDGLSEQARGFWNLYSYYDISEKDSTLENKTLKKKMKSLVAEDSLRISAGNKNMAQIELLLTEYFIRYLEKNNEQGVKHVQLWRSYLPVKKESIMKTAQQMLAGKKDEWGGTEKSLYSSLKDELQHYYDIVKKGGWSTIPYTKRSIKKGKAAPVITYVKKRLQMTGELEGNDTTSTFNDTLENAIKSFQAKLGYTPTGILTDSLIKDLNVPAEKRVEQLVININRMKWMPAKPAGKLIIVNIPEYKLHVYEGTAKAFDMNVVVGKEGKNTVVFTGNLNQIVFSPYWNIPASIVKKEILPKMQEEPAYLEEENIEITGEENGVPVMRQLPGSKNALGKVKFLFPNSFNIYFHDTPAKNLFEKDKRAYSHGCIRLSEPVKMANYLLQNQKQWTAEKIDSFMNSNEEKYVALKEPVPVMVTYYTAWIDESGTLNLRDDLYGHDSLVAAKMFTDK